jgi:hypothetical protein
MVSVSDINGNHKPDLLITAPEFNTSSGTYYIFFDYSLDDTSLNDVDADVQISTGIEGSLFSKNLVGDGDFNGDGISDFVISIPEFSPQQLFLLAGNKDENVNLVNAAVSIISQETILNKGAELSSSLSLSGDVNGDGFSDLLIGADFSDSSIGTNTGSSFLLLGRDDTSTLLNLELNQSTTINIEFMGSSEFEHFGYSVAILPDINGDGLDDIMISSLDHTSQLSTATYLFYGSKTVFDLSQAKQILKASNADASFIHTSDSGFGDTVVGLGDINGDLYGDFAISAPFSDEGDGKVFIFLGGPGTPYSEKNINALTQSMTIEGTNQSFLGFHSLSRLGDIDGDNLQDFGIGTYLSNNQKGEVYIFLGKNGFEKGSNILATLADITLTPDSNSERMGYSLSPGNDFNQDYIDEFFVSARESGDVTDNMGIIRSFSLHSNIIPTAIGTFSVFSDSDRTFLATTVENTDVLYLRIEANDPNSSTENIIQIGAIFETNSINVNMVETTPSSGTYEGELRISSGRSSKLLSQLSVDKGNPIEFKYESISLDTVSVVNSVPEITSFSISQSGIGDETSVELSYIVSDSNFDKINFTTEASQIQKFNFTSDEWENLSELEGPVSDINSSPRGIAYSRTNILNIGNVEEIIRVRIRPSDDETLGEYFESNSIIVDNTNPSSPILNSVTTKNAVNITVSGTAEASSIINIYRSDSSQESWELISTTNTDSIGNFQAFPVPITNTISFIAGVSIDSVGNESPTSNVISVSFGPILYEEFSGELSIAFTLEEGVVTSDQTINFEEIPTNSLAAITGPPNEFYSFESSFKVGDEKNDLSTPVFTTLTFDEAFSSTSDLRLMLWNETTSSWNLLEMESISANELSYYMSSFGYYSIMGLNDKGAPSISELFINNMPINSNFYYTDTPFITVNIEDIDSGIASYSISLKNETDETIKSNSGVFDVKTTTFSPTLNITEPLADGTYTIDIIAFDNGINSTSLERTFLVNESELIIETVFGPNPWNPTAQDLIIGINASQSIDSIQLYIFDQRQQKMMEKTIDSFSFTGGGYHSVSWDGLTSNQNVVKNGIYYGYIIIESSSGTYKEKIKIMVIK